MSIAITHYGCTDDVPQLLNYWSCRVQSLPNGTGKGVISLTITAWPWLAISVSCSAWNNGTRDPGREMHCRHEVWRNQTFASVKYLTVHVFSLGKSENAICLTYNEISNGTGFSYLNCICVLFAIDVNLQMQCLRQLKQKPRVSI